MKKLAIMFVMLLGSVATMQAQSFDFACETIDSGAVDAESFSTADVAALVGADDNFLVVGTAAILSGVVDANDAPINIQIVVEFNDGIPTYHLGIAGDVRPYLVLSDAIAAAKAGMHPIVNNNGQN